MTIDSQYTKLFNDFKKRTKLKADGKYIDEVFSMKDFFKREGYVSERVSRMMSSRITDFLMTWYNYLHGILLPNPNSLLNNTESQFFGDAEKQQLAVIMDRIMVVLSKNTINAIHYDERADAKWIDEAVRLWKDLKPSMLTHMGCIHQGWVAKAKESSAE